MISKAFLFLCMLLLSCRLSAAEVHHLHVKKAADFATVIRQARQWPACDTVYVHVASGTYHLTTPILFTEHDTTPMVFVGEGKRPVISGGMRLTEWEKTPEGWWRCHVPDVVRYGWRFEQLYINGRRAVRARTPNTGFWQLDSVHEAKPKSDERFPPVSTLTVYAPPAQIALLRDIPESELEQALGVCFYKWNYRMLRILHAEPNNNRFYSSGQGQYPWNPVKKGSRYYFENLRSALDNPGEWYLDSDGTLLYIPLPGEDLSTAEVYAPVLRQVVSIRGTARQPVSHKTFRNLCFTHTAFYTPIKGSIPNQAAVEVDGAIQMDHARHITLEDCEVQHTGNYAMWIRSQCYDNRVRHCYFANLGAGGIKIGCDVLPKEGEEVTGRNEVDNCIIHHGGYVHPSAVGVALLHTAHNRITHNEIADLRYSGVSVGWVWGYTYSPSVDNLVAYNHIHHLGWGLLSDMGAIYTLGTSPGTRIIGNVVHDIYTYDYGGWGIYTDEGSTGILIENNLVYRTKSGGFHQHFGRDNIVRNNIFDNAILQQLQLTRAEKHRSFTFQHNIVATNRGKMFRGAWNKGIIDRDYNAYFHHQDEQPDFLGISFAEWKKKYEPHAVYAAAPFRNPAAGDYRLTHLKLAKKIGFKPFDYSKAGVYGSEEWKAKTTLSPEILQAYVEMQKAAK